MQRVCGLLLSLIVGTLGGTLPSRGQSTDTSQNREETFTLVAIGEAKAADQTRLGFRNYHGSRGTNVDVTYGTFQSPEGAKAQLRLWLNAAIRIIKQEPQKDLSGKVIGARVVIVVKDARRHQEYNALIWTKGADYYQIESSCLRAALQIEDRINNGMDISGEKGPPK